MSAAQLTSSESFCSSFDWGYNGCVGDPETGIQTLNRMKVLTVKLSFYNKRTNR